MLNKALCAAAAGLAVISVGCATTSPDATGTTVQAIYGTVRNLDKEMGKELDQLRTTTADLSEQVGENDRQSRRIASLLEENQVRLEGMQQRLDGLVRVVYREAGLTPPRTASPGVSDVSLGGSPASGTGDVYPPGTQLQDIREPAGAGEEILPIGLDGGAEESYGEAPPAEETPSDPVDLARSPITEYQDAQAAYIDEDYERAAELYSAYIRRYPNSEYTSNAHRWLGRAYFETGQYEEAIETYEALRRKYPESRHVPYAYYNEAHAHNELGNTDKAIELLEELIDNYPTSEPARSAVESLRNRRTQ